MHRTSFGDLPTELRSRIFEEAYRLSEEDARERADAAWAAVAPAFQHIAVHRHPKMPESMWRLFRADHATARGLGVRMDLRAWFCSVVC